MKRFAQLFTELDQTNSTNAKVMALARYFDAAPDEDKLWAIALLAGKRPRRSVRTTLMKEWAAEVAGIPFWLFEECYTIVGDLGETISVVIPQLEHTELRSLAYWMDYIARLERLDDEQKRQHIVAAWQQMDQTERFVFNKLIGGSFRVGLSQKLMVKALAKHTGVEENQLAHRLMGNWSPLDTNFKDLVFDASGTGDISKPYPFYLAYALEGNVRDLGNPNDWFAERKWDGIRGQVIVRDGHLFTWSRGEELVTDKFPEFEALVTVLPNGTVLDGEILPFKDGLPMAFQDMQTRIGRKNVSKKILETTPVVLVAYDLLELDGNDLRDKPLKERRAMLEALVVEASRKCKCLLLSELVEFNDWKQLARERDKSRELHCEGIMLKRKDSAYKVGRKKGDWWKWKIDPLVIDAVMIYAMRGHGRRANLYTDYTFAVWEGEQLVPFTKAYSGLTDEEILAVDQFVKRNTIDRFGPVRSVTPELVFEVAFEGIQRSTRHKSGVALRFPRINRWRKDKPAKEANTMNDLKQLLEQYGKPI